MVVDRSAELCGSCHVRGGPDGINASKGFIRHHEQWDEMFQSTKHVMRCVDCHDPHKSSRYDVDGGVSFEEDESLGMWVACESCHFNEAAQQKSVVMDALLNCIDCHMPRVSKSALANGPYEGDVRTHLFSINTDAEAFQFTEDGSESMPYLTLDFACRACHKEEPGDPQPNSEQSDAELEACAEGYHDAEGTGACE